MRCNLIHMTEYKLFVLSCPKLPHLDQKYVLKAEKTSQAYESFLAYFPPLQQTRRPVELLFSVSSLLPTDKGKIKLVRRSDAIPPTEADLQPLEGSVEGLLEKMASLDLYERLPSSWDLSKVSVSPPRGAHIGSVFQLSQDNIEGDYLLKLAMDGRQVILGSDEKLLHAIFIEESTDTHYAVYAKWDELMRQTLQWLGRFGEPGRYGGPRIDD